MVEHVQVQERVHVHRHIVVLVAQYVSQIECQSTRLKVDVV